MPAVERLWGLYDERERLARLARAEPFTAGKSGPVPNPVWRQVRQCDSEIRQLEDRFGLSPMARLRLGVRFGKAARSLDELNRQMLADFDAGDILDVDFDDPRSDDGRT